jgi:hypothetical protein
MDMEIWLEKVNKRGHMEELGTDVRIILNVPQINLVA